MTRLALTVPFHEEEHTESFVSRLAANNGANLREFLRHIGVQFDAFSNGESEALEKLAYLANVPVSNLVDRAVRHIEGKVYIAGEFVRTERVNRFHYRYCPLCHEEDRQLGIGVSASRPYGRLAWLVDFVTACPKHEIALHVGNVENDDSLGRDFAQQMAAIATDTPATACNATRFERYVSERLLGKKAGDLPFLDSVPVHVAVGLCETVGATETFGLAFKRKSIDAADWVAVRQRGFDILAPYANAFDRYARKVADAALPRAGMTSGGKIYGAIYRDLKRTLKHPDFDRYREILRETGVERLPLGPRDNIFGNISKRKWHSVYTAALEYGMSPSTMDSVLELAGVPVLRRRSTYHATLVDAEQVAAFILKYRSARNHHEARRYLALPVGCWETLIKRKLLHPFMRKPERGKVSPLFAANDLDSLMERLAGSSTRESRRVGLVDMLDARQEAGSTFEEILDLLLDRRLKKIALNDDAPGLRSIALDPDEIRNVMSSRSSNVVDAGTLISPGAFRRLAKLERLVSSGMIAVADNEVLPSSHATKLMAWSVELFGEPLLDPENDRARAMRRRPIAAP